MLEIRSKCKGKSFDSSLQIPQLRQDECDVDLFNSKERLYFPRIQNEIGSN